MHNWGNTFAYPSIQNDFSTQLPVRMENEPPLKIISTLNLETSSDGKNKSTFTRLPN